MSAKIVHSREVKSKRNATSSEGRKANATYRTREHLTEVEMAKLLDALKRNRHGDRDRLIGLLIFRHGLCVSEACDLRWDDIDLSKRTIIVRIPGKIVPSVFAIWSMDLKRAMAINARRERQARKLTQEELADRADLSARYLG